jgi:hypothetical protein
MGYSVAAVDQDPEMLRRVRGGERILANVEELCLQEHFDGIILGSYFVNSTDTRLASQFLASSHRHLAQNGKLLFERVDPDWARTVEPGFLSNRSGIVTSIKEVHRVGPYFSALFQYVVHKRMWLQPFAARILDDDEIEELLRGSGLAFVNWIDDEKTWGEARHSNLPRPQDESGRLCLDGTTN